MELKTIKLQGKDYCQVVDRLKYFNTADEYKDWRILTTHKLESGLHIFEAKVTDSKGNFRASGHGAKSIKAEFNMEKAETRAIGRALGILGIGSDGSISSADEVAEAIDQPLEINLKDKKI